MSQVSEASYELLVNILNDESPYHLQFLDHLEKQIITECNEYAVLMARMQVLRPRIIRNHQAYVRIGGGTVREYTRLELAPPALEEAPPEPEALSLAAGIPAPTPASTPTRRRGGRKPQPGLLSLEEYITFVHMVKQEFKVFPGAEVVARYYQTRPARVSKLKYQATKANRLPRFANPPEQRGLLSKITESFGPYKLTQGR